MDIKEYEYKKYPVLGGESNRSLGIELELLPNWEMKQDVFSGNLDYAFPEDAFIAKRDSSIESMWYETGYDGCMLDGLEIVSGIMSPSWWREFDWSATVSGLHDFCLLLPPDENPFVNDVGTHIHANGTWGCS